MRRFIELSYRGTNYHGWQRQPNAVSVQQCVEDALSTILQRPISITGAGRTDTGVHARIMYAHFDTDSLITMTDERMAAALNSMCGKDIAIARIFPVENTLHARFSAIQRSYKYFVHYKKEPFLEGLSWRSPGELDIEAMNKAASELLSIDDFTSFAKLHSDAKTNICNVTKAFWTPSVTPMGNEGLIFEISADRFLRNMVRAIVGTLIEVGRKKISNQGFLDVIASHNRCMAATSMPAYALYLWDVKYVDF